LHHPLFSFSEPAGDYNSNNLAGLKCQITVTDFPTVSTEKSESTLNKI
jgi:hypothetical protein